MTSGDVARRWCISVVVGGELRDAGTRTIIVDVDYNVVCWRMFMSAFI